MSILILALGSRGDVLPYVTLGGALRQAGHTVRIATFDFFAPLVEAAGVELLPIKGDPEGLLRQAADGMLNTGGEKLSNPLAMLRTFRALQRSYGQLVHSLPDTLSAERLAGTGLVLTQLPAYLFGEDLAEIASRQSGRRIPWAILSVIPLARTVHRPLLGIRALPTWLPLPFRQAYNRWTYRAGEQIGWQMFRKAINRLRAANGLPAQPFWGHYDAWLDAPRAGQPDQRIPVICGFSPQVVPPPADWGAHIHLTGWWWPPETTWFERHSPSPLPASHANPALEQFIQAGPPPVFIGLGSMPVTDPAATSHLFIEATRLAGVRLLLHSGWAGLSLPQDPDGSVFSISYAPYAWLFPQMSLVVHHGGSGTTGYALAGGVPSLILPFTFDQFYWGERSHALGVGPPSISFARLSTPTLAAAIRQVKNNPAYGQAAASLAARLRGENGLAQAVERIEELLR